LSDGSSIEWTDATWSPVTGCTKISNGCLNCYIERTPPFRMAHRKFDKPGIGGTTGVQLHPDRLGQPFRWRKPRRIFVCSLADLFHSDVPDDHIIDVWSVMAATPRHTYQVLTKRPARMRALLSASDFREKVARRAAGRMEDGDHWLDYLMFERKAWPLPNVWGGVTAEDQPRADQRIPILLNTPLAVRWVSVEPMLSSIRLPMFCACGCRKPIGVAEREARLNPGYLNEYQAEAAVCSTLGVDWVVLGGESGPGARPMDPVWARSVRDQCVSAGVPFLFKQWGGRTPKANGRLLDGRTWDEYPAMVTS